MLNTDLEVANVALGLIGPLGITGLFLYIRGIKADVRDSRCDLKDVAKDLKEFKNGHYKQHIDEAYDRGIKDSKIEALHRRMDRAKKLVG